MCFWHQNTNIEVVWKEIDPYYFFTGVIWEIKYMLTFLILLLRFLIVFIFKFLGPLGEDFYAEDFYLLEKITFTKLVQNIEDIVENTEINSKK